MASLACLFALLAIVPATAGDALGASPAASQSPPPGATAEPSEPPPEGPPSIEAWLDRPVPSDAAPGSTLDVGVVLWDPRAGSVESTGTVIFVRVHDAAGGAIPPDGAARQNWRGHYAGTIEVPARGLGLLQFGVRGTACDDSGCTPSDWIFPIAGAGSPPDAPVTSLATATIDPPAGPLVAGQPAKVTIRLHPNAGLDLELFAMPESLVVRAREPRGPNLATATLSRVEGTGAADGAYAGSLTIPAAGDVVLEAATDADGGDATRFGTSLTRIIVAPASSAPAAAAGGVPWPVAAALVVALGLAMLAALRFVGGRLG